MPLNVAEYPCPKIATDIIIEYVQDGRVYIPLIERKNPPLGIALPGGFQEIGLTLAANARKEAKEETNLEVIIDHPEKPFLVLSDPKRDPRGPVIGVVFIANGHGDLKAGDDAKHVQLYTPQQLKKMRFKNRFVFDHEYILTQYLHHRGYSP